MVFIFFMFLTTTECLLISAIQWVFGIRMDTLKYSFQG